MARSEAIPIPAVRRLSLYLRELEALSTTDHRTVSSRQLSAALGITDAQVRKDLAHFGQFGQPGIGYRVDELTARMRVILGADRTWNIVLMGAGNLGRALIAHERFSKRHFHVVAVFDKDKDQIGRKIPGTSLKVQPPERLADAVTTHRARLGIIAVPPTAAQLVADQMIAAGVRGILNFAPTNVQVREGIALTSVDVSIQLEQLAFLVNEDGPRPADG